MTSDFHGIILRIGATMFFTLMTVCVKWLADTVPLGQVVFYRSACALIPLVIYLFATGDFPRGLATRRPMAHVLRCILGCTAMFASFAALRYLPLAHASVIGYLAPILAVLLARALLGEIVNRTRWISVMFGFLGVLVLVIPEATGVQVDPGYLLGVGLALTMAIFTAGAKIQIRSLARTENAGAIALYFALTCALAGLATAPLGWVSPTPEQLIYLVGAGAAGGIAHIMMTLAMKHSEVSKLAPFEYLALIFAVIADALFFGVIPGIVFYIAAACIVMATLIVVAGDRRRPKLPIAGHKA
ncbi:DMT family transporter [Roseovarius sp. MMSF_3281]|uniref:DMT family transporter n=1 Tax=Roseovarius sp. MMSF_3281 TaxID=3046694 RepID=UPI00273D86DC|nr:DMT family transporter [Roseovarius sp. MMSF_3281]